MKITQSKWFVPGIIVGVIAVIAMILGGTYNGLVQDREKVRTAFSNVQTQYQRRADLIPNLVNTVKGVSDFEQETLTDIVEARSKATGINVDADNPEQVQQFVQAQQEVSGALSRLLVVVENYPTLKASEAYRDLIAQLEGTENRIQVARADYNEAARPYNARIQTFPTNLVAGLFGFSRMEPFTADEGSDQAPTVDFNTGDGAE